VDKPSPELLDFADRLVRAPSWAETIQLIQAHPELLSPAEVLLEGMLSRQELDPPVRQLIADHHRLLVLADRLGPTRALEHFAPFKTDAGRDADVDWISELLVTLTREGSWHRRRQFLERHPFLMNGVGADLADLHADPSEDAGVKAAWRATSRLLRQCQRDGIAEAVLEGAIVDVIQAANVDAALAVSSDYPPVVSAAAGRIARRWLESLDDTDDRAEAERRWLAFEDLWKEVADHHPQVSRDLALLEYSDVLDQLAATEDTSDMVQLFHDHAELLDETAETLARRRRDDTESFRTWWIWDRYVRLLADARSGGLMEAVRAFQMRDFYELTCACSAYLAVETALEEFALVTAFPLLLSEVGLHFFGEAVRRSGGEAAGQALERVARLRYVLTAGIKQIYPRSPDVWIGRRLQEDLSGNIRRVGLGVFSEIPVLALGMLEAAVRVGTYPPAEAAEVAMAGATLHLQSRFSGTPPIDRAIELLQLAVEQTPRTTRGAPLDKLSQAWAERFEKSGRVSDLDAAVAAAREGLEAANDDPMRNQIQQRLALLLATYPSRAYRQDRVREAVAIVDELVAEAERTAAAGTSAAIVGLRGLKLHVLCRALAECPQRDEAMELWDNAVALTERLGTTDGFLLVAATGYNDGRRPGWRIGPATLDLARRAEALADDPDARQDARTCQAALLLLAVERDGADELLLERCLDLTAPSPESEVPWSAHTESDRRRVRALALMLRHEADTRRIDELDEAIDLLRGLRADDVGGGPISTPGLLSRALTAKQEVSGEPRLLDEAIELLTPLVAERPHDPSLAANLASLFRRRFVQRGRIDDLDEAIETSENARASLTDQPGARRGFLNNLANAYSERFRILGRRDDRNQSLSLFEELLADGLDEPDARARVLSNLGLALLARAEETDGDADADMDRALLVAREGVDLTPPGSLYLPRRTNNLATIQQVAAVRRGDGALADRAIENFRKALDLAGPESPFRGQYQLGLLSAMYTKASISGNEEDLRATAQLGDEMLDVAAAQTALWVPQGGRLLGRCRAALGDWSGAAESLRRGADALILLTQAHVQPGYRLGWLRTAGSLLMEAAFALAKSGNLAAAIDIAERSRATELTRALNLFDLELEDLERTGYAPLARRWRQLAVRLAAQERQAVAAEGGTSEARPVDEGLLSRLQEVRAEIDAVLGRQSAEVVAAATHVTNAIPVYLVTTTWGGLAILLRAGQPKAVWLPELSAEWVESVAISLVGGAPEELVEVIPPLVDTLAEQLRELVEETAGSPVILVATGLLGALPLHAAMSRRDYAAAEGRLTPVRYAPNLWTVRRRGSSCDDLRDLRVTAVSAAPGILTYSLPEAQLAAGALQAGSTLIPAGASGLEALETALREPGVVHVACHAYAVPERPLESALEVSEGLRLTLARVMESTVGARLVVMSACSTARTGENLPDEVVGLPTGLIQAGAEGVVATLWPVADDACLFLMLRFYEQLRAGSPPWIALPEAQDWLRTASSDEIRTHLAELAAGADEGGWPPTESLMACQEAVSALPADEVPFSHPLDWAGFVYVGS
jgi:tetratricopeptide (TPR) repeat protein